MAPDVTVCVATCQRPVGLARLLSSLEQLAVPAGVELEIVVVDNDPERSARDVLARLQEDPSAGAYVSSKSKLEMILFVTSTCF